jgi:hypothetical protein
MVHAETTRVLLDPSSQTVGAVGDSFAVNVSVADVSNLYGYTFELFYDSTVMNGTQVIEGPFLKSEGQTFFYVTNFTDHYNSSEGVVLVSCTLMVNISGVSGSGVLTTIEFKSLTTASSTPLHLADVELGDRQSSPIPCEDVDGAVTVIPEFTSLAAFLTSLITASLFSIFVAKRARRKVNDLNP